MVYFKVGYDCEEILLFNVIVLLRRKIQYIWNQRGGKLTFLCHTFSTVFYECEVIIKNKRTTLFESGQNGSGFQGKKISCMIMETVLCIRTGVTHSNLLTT